MYRTYTDTTTLSKTLLKKRKKGDKEERPQTNYMKQLIEYASTNPYSAFKRLTKDIIGSWRIIAHQYYHPTLFSSLNPDVIFVHSFNELCVLQHIIISFAMHVVL